MQRFIPIAAIFLLVGTAAPASAQTHTVKSGQTLWGIAKSYGCQVAEIQKANKLRSTTIKPGQKLARGEKVGLMGSTGRSTGPHLHYQVNVNGVPVDPRNYMLD